MMLCPQMWYMLAMIIIVYIHLLAQCIKHGNFRVLQQQQGQGCFSAVVIISRLFLASF